MQVMSMNDFLPAGKKVRKIHTGSELLLAYELDKYARKMLGATVKLTDVSVAKELLGSAEFSFVVMNGLDVGFQVNQEDLVSYKAILFFTQDVEGIHFASVTPELVVYDYNSDVSANSKLHSEDRACGYVSLIAYLMVKAHVEGVPVPKVMIGSEQYNNKQGEYGELIILRDYGNKIISEMLDLRHNSQWGLQPEWESFVMYNRQRGHMARQYLSTEKHKVLRKNFAVGDVVLMYTRKKAAKGVQFKILQSCYPAVIRRADEKGLTLEYFPLIQTKLTRNVVLQDTETDLEDDGKVSPYTEDDYNAFVRCEESFRLTDIGVDVCTFDEDTFFLAPLDFDGTYQYFRTPSGMQHVFLSTLDTIYAVFEDRGIEYNKDRFLQKYFKNRTPVYDTYMNQNMVH